MSLYYNDYIITSNNSINDNKYNAKLAAESKTIKYNIKKILKPLIKMLKNKKTILNKEKHCQQCYCDCQEQQIQQNYDNLRNSSLESSAISSSSMNEEQDFWSSEMPENDNSANEELESRIFNEIEQCDDNAAVYVYENDECELQQISRTDKVIPVNFARTEAGTFFWTSMVRSVDYDLVQPLDCYSRYQLPRPQQTPMDRWVQA